MAIKETIAFIGIPATGYTILAKHLAQGSYRLLFVSNDESQPFPLSQQFLQHSSDTEIETIECTKDGCWEADIIVLEDEKGPEQYLIERIKEVATQKIVILMSKDNHELFSNKLQKLKQDMPNSKVIGLFYKTTSSETLLTGNDKEAVTEVSNLLEKVGYKRNENSSQKGIVYRY